MPTHSSKRKHSTTHTFATPRRPSHIPLSQHKSGERHAWRHGDGFDTITPPPSKRAKIQCFPRNEPENDFISPARKQHVEAREETPSQIQRPRFLTPRSSNIRSRSFSQPSSQFTAHSQTQTQSECQPHTPRKSFSVQPPQPSQQGATSTTSAPNAWLLSTTFSPRRPRHRFVQSGWAARVVGWVVDAASTGSSSAPRLGEAEGWSVKVEKEGRWDGRLRWVLGVIDGSGERVNVLLASEESSVLAESRDSEGGSAELVDKTIVLREPVEEVWLHESSTQDAVHVAPRDEHTDEMDDPSNTNNDPDPGPHIGSHDEGSNRPHNSPHDEHPDEHHATKDPKDRPPDASPTAPRNKPSTQTRWLVCAGGFDIL